MVDPIQKRDNYICQYCGKDGLASLDNWHDSTKDHFIPQSQGGTSSPENLITSCGYCNAIKGEKLFSSLEAAKAYVLKRRTELQQDYEKVRNSMRV
jgi:5-methylcytosine-specific restriction endonuclease McrA